MADTVRLVSDGEELVLTQAEPARASAEVDGRANSLDRRTAAGRPRGRKPEARRGVWSRWLRGEKP
jgi:hypothetical protein